MDNRPIGVFDSGIGGLSICRSIFDEFKNERVIYIGDTKRAPYGIRNYDEIHQFSLQMSEYLYNLNCKALIIACNTIAAISGTKIRRKVDIPVLDVITPTVNDAIRISRKNVLIFATNATIKSKIHKDSIKKMRRDLNFHEQACTLFVPIVEEGFYNKDVARAATKEYYLPFLDKNIDSLILGCTHFQLMKMQIKNVVGENIKIIDPSISINVLLKKLLQEKRLNADDSIKDEHMFYCSGDFAKFRNALSDILKFEYYSKKIKLRKISL